MIDLSATTNPLENSVSLDADEVAQWHAAGRNFPKFVSVYSDRYPSVHLENIDFGKGTMVILSQSLICTHITAGKISHAARFEKKRKQIFQERCSLTDCDIDHVVSLNASVTIQNSSLRSISLINPLDFSLTDNRQLEDVYIKNIHYATHGFLKDSPKAKSTNKKLRIIRIPTPRDNTLFAENGHYIYQFNSAAKDNFLAEQARQKQVAFDNLLGRHTEPLKDEVGQMGSMHLMTGDEVEDLKYSSEEAAARKLARAENWYYEESEALEFLTNCVTELDAAYQLQKAKRKKSGPGT